jgi:NADH dehydrogenase [ubiquinone] 1 alpha subcomplex assembly factor 6
MEGYLCGLLMPSSSREAYFALRAFNVEIASIKDSSKLIGGRSRSSYSGGGPLFDVDDDLGGDGRSQGDITLASRLRMQWWRDAIADLYEHADNKSVNSSSSSQDPIIHSLTASRRHNPTLRSLTHAIKTHNLTYRFLRRIIEAREEDLSVVQYQKWTDVAQYGEDTVSNILYLSLETVGVRDDESDKVASDIGVGLGVITALRSTAFRASQGECSIPLDLAVKHDVSMETLYHAWDASTHVSEDSSSALVQNAKVAKESLRGATLDMVEMASFHLHRARENQGKVPKEGRMCLLPAVCGLKYLDSLKECNYEVLHPGLVGGGDDAAAIERRRRLSLMFMLGRTWLTGTF